MQPPQEWTLERVKNLSQQDLAFITGYDRTTIRRMQQEGLPFTTTDDGRCVFDGAVSLHYIFGREQGKKYGLSPLEQVLSSAAVNCKVFYQSSAEFSRRVENIQEKLGATESQTHYTMGRLSALGLLEIGFNWRP